MEYPVMRVKTTNEPEARTAAVEDDLCSIVKTFVALQFDDCLNLGNSSNLRCQLNRHTVTERALWGIAMFAGGPGLTPLGPSTFTDTVELVDVCVLNPAFFNGNRHVCPKGWVN